MIFSNITLPTNQDGISSQQESFKFMLALSTYILYCLLIYILLQKLPS